MGVAERRRREKEDRRRLIMEAAARVFMRCGYAAVNTNLIADEAEVAVGTFYLYFHNKEEVLLDILKEGTARLYGVIREAAEGHEDPVEALQAIGAAYVGYAQQNPEFYDVQQYFQHGAFVRTLAPDVYQAWLPEIRHVAREALRMIEEQIRRGKKAGLLEPTLVPREVAVLAWSTMSGALQIAANPELREISEMNPEQIVGAALRSILSGMAPKARGRLPRRVK
ncbi:MAG: TetR/AcrR family transcriptional regulator [Candidatus Binatia bacterium]